MSLVASILQELLGGLAVDGVGGVLGKPLTRLRATLRGRLTPAALLIAWAIALGLMTLAWRLGVRATHPILQLFAVLVWTGAPVTALLLTGVWWHRRDA
jgi:hypothetical protein